jgi:hypothetical protein
MKLRKREKTSKKMEEKRRTYEIVYCTAAV